ncbi:MAG: hypothetical protein A3E88_05825 [Legionellales bacterium RIFCSPHIGHO2_12_FULL_35_11]|nr:MAG: hypothetical protein A3E88_05825 [Legionellales bacterium RIFCSPHIGHO2_12_FULL_35_11]
MSRKEFLENLLTTSLCPDYIEIEDESHNHKGAKNLESHFKAIIVSDKFKNLSKIARHRLIFSIIADEFNNMHALTLALYTSEEWSSKIMLPAASPKCAKNIIY